MVGEFIHNRQSCSFPSSHACMQHFCHACIVVVVARAESCSCLSMNSLQLDKSSHFQHFDWLNGLGFSPHVLEVGITIIIKNKVSVNLLLSLFIDRSGNPLEGKTGF